jgi:transcriptional antiterminator RfaH
MVNDTCSKTSGLASPSYNTSCAAADPRQHWYVLQTKPKQEARAEANLRRWGLETFAPLLREHRRLSRASTLPYRAAPLFPGYVFARFDADVLLSKVRLTRGVSRVVDFGGHATPIDDAVIGLIRGRLDESGYVSLEPPRSGDVVEIIDGPLRSMEGIFERHLQGQDRVVILLASVACRAHVEVETSFIRVKH